MRLPPFFGDPTTFGAATFAARRRTILEFPGSRSVRCCALLVATVRDLLGRLSHVPSAQHVGDPPGNERRIPPGRSGFLAISRTLPTRWLKRQFVGWPLSSHLGRQLAAS